VGVGLSRNRAAFTGLALVLLSACAYGITPALMKLAYRAQLGELSLIGLRSAIGAALVALVAQAVGETRIPRSAAVRLAALGALLYGPQMWLYFASLHWVDTAVAVGVVYVYPAIVVLLTAVRRRRSPPAGEVVLVFVALLGVAIIALTAGPSRVGPPGVALAAVAALGYAGMSWLRPRSPRTYPYWARRPGCSPGPGYRRWLQGRPPGSWPSRPAGWPGSMCSCMASSWCP
jgi:drug/metabolite transporter (DMT)-like permease